MNLRDFKSGKYVQRYQYHSFEPEFINHSWIWDDPEINVLLEKANKLLGELNAYTSIVPDIDLFIEMHIAKEATQSSKIEGTSTEIDEVLTPIQEIPLEKRDDWKEVHNYISAMNYAVDRLLELPLSNRLIKETHRILLEGTRGDYKTPGEFRISQNWIGGNSPSDAVFVPPHNESLPYLLSDLEKFFHNNELIISNLIRIALIHYQFETIHPFQDGNGRIGRLLITLFLVEKGILEKPSLYLSDYFEKNRALYYDSLTLVREKSDLVNWITFFLNAIISTAQKSIGTFKKMLQLKDKYDIITLNSKTYANDIRSIIYYMYRTPVANEKELSNHLKRDRRTIKKFMKYLMENGIIRTELGAKRMPYYYLYEYLDVFLDKS